MILQRVYVFVLLIGTQITTNVASLKPGHKPSATRYIFQPPRDSNVSQISGTSTPWVIPYLIPTIEEFKKNVFEDLQNSSTVQSIWDLKFESSESRAIFFKLVNTFLYDINHLVPSALTNTVSKAASLFDPLNMTVFFESYAYSLAEFLLSRDIEINRETATTYVSYTITNLDLKPDLTNKELFFQAALCGYSQFIESFGFKLVDIIDELFQLYVSQLIVLHDK